MEGDTKALGPHGHPWVQLFGIPSGLNEFSFMAYKEVSIVHSSQS